MSNIWLSLSIYDWYLSWYHRLYTNVPMPNYPPGDNYVKNDLSYPYPKWPRRMLIFYVFKKRKIFLKSSHDPEFNLLNILHSFLNHSMKKTKQSFNNLSYLSIQILLKFFTFIFYSVWTNIFLIIPMSCLIMETPTTNFLRTLQLTYTQVWYIIESSPQAHLISVLK